jgi:hypothetical protein
VCRKQALLFPRVDIDAPALDEICRQTLAQHLPLGFACFVQPRERWIDQPEEAHKGVLVAAVRRGGQKHHVAFHLLGEPGQELVALLHSASGTRACMRLINNYEVRARPQKIVATALTLHIVEADHSEWMNIEDALARRKIALQPTSARARHRDRMDLEFRCQLPHPLIDEMWRAKHRKPINLPAVEKLSRNQSPLDCLSDSDIVGDQEAHHVELERHQERHELIGARLEPDATGAAERAGTAAQREQQGVPQKQCLSLRPVVLRRRRIKRSRHHGVWFQRGIEHLYVAFSTRERTKPKQILRRIGKDDPFAPTSPDERAGREGEDSFGHQRSAAKKASELVQSSRPVAIACGKHDEIDPTMAQLVAIRETGLAEACRDTVVRPDDNIFSAVEL